MNQFYRVIGFLALLSFTLLTSIVTIVPYPHPGILLKLSRHPDAWDLAFHENPLAFRDLTPEEAKSELIHFSQIYRPNSYVQTDAAAIASLIILAFSIIGLLRERHFRKAATPKTPD